ncbi:MAG: hypothetical protein JXQ79_02060 [Rhodobacteraceae bacterium]|nr:hypothetical protein [Paracoccaceae bacterium]
MQEYWNAAFKAVTRLRWFFVMRPEAAMAHAAMPRHQRELNIWRMALALQIDMVDAIKSGALTRDAPLDLLQSITRRCAACHHTDECVGLLIRSGDRLLAPPEYCRVKNRLMALSTHSERPPRKQDQAS